MHQPASCRLLHALTLPVICYSCFSIGGWDFRVAWTVVVMEIGEEGITVKVYNVLCNNEQDSEYLDLSESSQVFRIQNGPNMTELGQIFHSHYHSCNLANSTLFNVTIVGVWQESYQSHTRTIESLDRKTCAASATVRTMTGSHHRFLIKRLIFCYSFFFFVQHPTSLVFVR